MKSKATYFLKVSVKNFICFLENSENSAYSESFLLIISGTVSPEMVVESVVG